MKQPRRTFVLWLALAPAAALAQHKKYAKAKVRYRPKPNDGKDCDDCFYFIPGKTADAPGACTIVEGDISPSGWCAEFKAKT